MSFRLFDHHRGLVVAPAGCGKTQAIVDALSEDVASPVLILTHTNAGVAALKTRLATASVSSDRFRLLTIDGWALRLASAFPSLSGFVPAAGGKVAYPATQRAALQALSGPALDRPIRASYSRLVVDEYQDCSRGQHAIVQSLAARLPTCVLGDPLQRIFDFRPADHPDWTSDVVRFFPIVETFDQPWRWINAGEAAFGAWVLSVRPALLGGGTIDLRSAPANVKWIAAPTDPGQRQAAHSGAINAIRPAAGHGLLVIGDSKNRQSRSDFARRMPGLSVVEPVDLGDLLEWCEKIKDSQGVARLAATLNFASTVMTEVDVTAVGKRLNSLQTNRARTPADDMEQACLGFAAGDSYVQVSLVLKALGASHRRVFRRHLLSAMLDALQRAISKPGSSLVDAAVSTREQRRAIGRPLPARAVGSTLLLKGLESEHAVILDADAMNARHLYVAISRASVSLTIFSRSPVLTLR